MLWSQEGKSMWLPLWSHLRAVTVVAISVKVDWIWPFRLKEGSEPHQILCLFLYQLSTLNNYIKCSLVKTEMLEEPHYGVNYHGIL